MATSEEPTEAYQNEAEYFPYIIQSFSKANILIVPCVAPLNFGQVDCSRSKKNRGIGLYPTTFRFNAIPTYAFDPLGIEPF